MSMWNQFMFQDPNSPLMENLIMFYDHAMLVVMLIISLIFYMLLNMFFGVYVNRYLFEGQMIEVIWTIIPMFMLIFLAIPSLKILYLIDELKNPMLTVKVIGHQWYWSYEYEDFNSIIFDSFMVSSNEEENSFRLLDVDNRMILPYQVSSRILISSTDVIHSFALPSLGLKVDALPGRINQIGVYISRPGLYYGQCSEICGVNHSFMPIVLESTSMEKFLDWSMKF